MRIRILSLLPQAFDSFLSYPVIRHAVDKGLVEIEVIDIRDYADGCWRAIDDSPYGGGAGLLLRVDVVKKALDGAAGDKGRRILLGPKGRLFDQKLAHELSHEKELVLIAGHYEGVDERVRSYIDDEVSIGDYILTGGESAAIVLAEAVIRLLDGAIKKASSASESFEDGILEEPQYTHPALFDGKSVPDVLMSGNKEAIARFNELEAIKDTTALRPDLIPSDRSFRFHTVHRDYGNEKDIITWIGDRLPCPRIVWHTDGHLVLEKRNARPLSSAGRKTILSTVSSILKALWSFDTTGCPVDMRLANRLSRLSLPWARWQALRPLMDEVHSDDLVLSHGRLTLEHILVNGNGLVAITTLAGCGPCREGKGCGKHSGPAGKGGHQRGRALQASGPRLRPQTPVPHAPCPLIRTSLDDETCIFPSQTAATYRLVSFECDANTELCKEVSGAFSKIS